ncbi:cytochrome c biogenesis protein DipZ [Uliginosibacterium sp. H3]|uniref:Cytochrome c biogenesis protein DipZ n=1 Tax=Uliginosibacterium silvisoli TaxID=3114758 RepID=A0ABU6K069_9RHOO|nr:cytochrome c biogenesis protein DipZ [Uliginosibacterium sp. H3]
MILLLLAYAGGVLTILSPCILPVLPFVFARAGQPFMRSSLPLLLGMAIMFALIATLAAVGGGWAVQVNQYGRVLAIILLGFFGLTLLFPTLSDRLTRPLVALGTRLSERSSQATREGRSSVVPSLLLGFATGLLWAPCAGPILGLILTGAALQGANTQTSLLLLAYALGAATSLALALLVGGKVFAALKRSLGAGEWIRRGLGVAVLAGVVAIALGLDTGVLAELSLARTSSIEQALVARIAPEKSPESAGGSMMMAAKPPADAAQALPVDGTLPSIAGAVEWLNSPPLTNEALRGKVVLVDFWTYSCINCLRTLPYLRAWADKYRDQGLVIIGVHAPEFAFEKDIDNVRAAVKKLGITYPVAIDNKFALWRAFDNNFWPAHYLADAQGRIRHRHVGEGEYEQTEAAIQKLLAEAGNANVKQGYVNADTEGVGMQSDWKSVRSPETYVGYARAENFVSRGGQVKDQAHVYAPATAYALNDWSLTGNWKVGSENATLAGNAGSITYRFKARDLHLVLGPGADGKPVRFRVRLDGAAPGASHGDDTDKDGAGTVTAQRLYQLVRQSGDMKEMTFEIEFLDPGVQAFAFTFG